MKSHNELHKKTAKLISQISRVIKVKKNLFFAVAIVLAILGIGIFLFINQRNQEATNLKNFYKLTSEDPLFYSSFFDSKEWKKSIGALKESENQLKKILTDKLEPTKIPGKNSYLKILKENNLFPYQFLENLVLINKKTNDFLESPSTKLGKELLALYDNATDSYIKNISPKIKILETNKENNDGFLFFIDSFSSYKVIKSDFLTIKENGYKLKEEIARRKNCLFGKESCEALLKTNENNSFIAFMKNMKNGNLGLMEKRIDFVKRMLLPSDYFIQNRIKGPYKIKSLCWQNPEFEQWLYFFYRKQDDRISILPKLATQNYYWKVNAGNTASQVEKILLKKGINFYFQIEATTYECTDLTFYPQLITLDFIKEQINNGKITQDDLTTNVDYKLLIENQFGLLPPAINAISDQLRTFNAYSKINKEIPPLPYLFSARAAYSILYFPYAKSIWRIDKHLQYFSSEKEKPSTGSLSIVTLDDLVKLGYTEAEVKRFIIPSTAKEFYNFLFPATKL